MATHNINKITVPNGDVYNLLDSGRSDFVTKSGLLTSTGTSTNNTMTQAAITNAVTSATPYIITWNYNDEDGPTVNISEVTEAITNNRPIFLVLLDSEDWNNAVYRLVDYGSESYGLHSLAFTRSVALDGYYSVEGRHWTRTSSSSTGEWTYYGTDLKYLGHSPITVTDNYIYHDDSGVTAQTTQALYPFTVNATGHITGVGSAITSMTPTSHTHGNITNAGDITTNAAIASGDRLVINDESASKLTNSSITFGTSTTQFLANNGTWQTPVGGVTDVQVNGTSVLSSGVANLVTNTAYNASTNKIATMADVDVMTITYSLISGTDYEMNISTVLAPNYANTILGEEY